jgi:hypothetical protein
VNAAPLLPDRGEIERFTAAIFRYADNESFLSIRAFDDTKESSAPPLFVKGVRIDSPHLIDRLYELALQAAQSETPAVFAPPIATFKNCSSAKTAHIANGLAITVECDSNPSAALNKLAFLLGEPTFTIRSGGSWLNPDTGLREDKLHLYWRLREPTNDAEGHMLLREANKLATKLVGADAASSAVIHPMRYPGSWHRKAEPPRLCVILHATETEVELQTALDLLREAAGGSEGASGKAGTNPFEEYDATSKMPPTGDLMDIAAALCAIPNNDVDWERWNTLGMATYRASEGHALAAFDAWSQKSSKYDPTATRARWNHYKTSPPSQLGIGSLIYWAREAAPGWRKPSDFMNDAEMSGGGAKASGQGAGADGACASENRVPLLDPWDAYIVPPFPFDVLPRDVESYVETHSIVVGCDPSALAIVCLANFSAALDHRFALKIMRNGSWWSSPRLWVLLVGDPSRKKTPIMKVAFSELEACQSALRDRYEQELAAYKESKDEAASEPAKPPRFITMDVTIEKLGDILSRQGRAGILIWRDEVAGWVGSMEKYSGRASKGTADRAFWLQAYDGGSYIIARVTRGEIHVENLSATIAGAIQPARLAELHGLTSDGLLQRFLPVMMGPSHFPQDQPTEEWFGRYASLTRDLLNAQPQKLLLDDAAIEAMEDIRRRLYEVEQVSGGLADGFQAFVGKLTGVTGSLALILHLISNPRSAERRVNRNVVEGAGKIIIDFVLPHAFEFYRTAETVTDGDRIQRLASYILTSKRTRIVASDLTTNVRLFRGMTLFDVNKSVSPLVAGGWLTPRGPGPLANAWVVNPAVFTQFAERTATEESRKAALAELMGSPRHPHGA